MSGWQAHDVIVPVAVRPPGLSFPCVTLFLHAAVLAVIAVLRTVFFAFRAAVAVFRAVLAVFRSVLAVFLAVLAVFAVLLAVRLAFFAVHRAALACHGACPCLGSLYILAVGAAHFVTCGLCGYRHRHDQTDNC